MNLETFHHIFNTRQGNLIKFSIFMYKRMLKTVDDPKKFFLFYFQSYGEVNVHFLIKFRYFGSFYYNKDTT